MSSPSTIISTENRPKSAEAFEVAKQLMPGGVNSPVRAFNAVGGAPVFFQKAKGAYVWDIDGNKYTDYVGTWGPAILGHAHPEVIARIKEIADDGTSFGAPTIYENKLAQLVIDMVPSIEKVRFVNSGTEAMMSCLRLARAFTGRTKIIKFSGCYHGHADPLLVKAGSGALTLGVPDSPGVPSETAANTLTANFNDLASVKTLLEANDSQVAAIMLEPVAGNMGCIPPADGFLQGLRDLCDAHGTLLIFDEVMTGFRVAKGGAQERYGVMPDITALGKIIGGGLPVGAYGGRNDIMAHVAPEGPMYQAGTLSGNPLAMVAGYETLTRLNDDDFHASLAQTTQKLAEGMLALCNEKNIPATVNYVGGMMSVFFNENPVTDFESATKSNKAHFDTFFHGMLNHGVYFAPSPYEAAFLSGAHTDADIDHTLAVMKTIF